MNGQQRVELILQGSALYNAGQAREAARILRSINFAEDERATAEYATWCCNLGAALAETGELSAAVELFETAATIHEQREEWDALANVQFNLGNVSRYAGSFEQAQRHYEAAHATYTRIGNVEGQVVTLQSLSNVELARGNHEAAREQLARLRDAVPNEAALSPRSRWSLDTLGGNIARMAGRFDEAVVFFTQALEHLDAEGDRSYRAEAETTLGHTLALAERLPEALLHLEAGAALWQELRNPAARKAAAMAAEVREALGHAPQLPALPADATGPRPRVPEAEADAEDTLLPIMQAKNVTDDMLATILRISREQFDGGLLVRLGGEIFFVALPEAEAWQVIDAATATAGEVAAVLRDRPCSHLLLLQAAQAAAAKGVLSRAEGDLHNALVATGFALRVSVLLQVMPGIDAVSRNLLALEGSIASLQTQPWLSTGSKERPSDEQFEVLRSQMRALGTELDAHLAALVEASAAADDQPARLRLLLAHRRVLATGHRMAYAAQNLIPAWAGGGLIGERAGRADRRRRGILAEAVHLAEDLGEHDEALAALYEELTHVRLSELMQALGHSNAVSDQMAQQLSIADPHEADAGAFDALWALYCRRRGWLAQTTSHDVMQACSFAVDHFTRLRLQAVYSGTASGHAASYAVSQFLSPLNRDFVSLLHGAGLYDHALEQAERTSARAMADWMGRTHLSSRLVFRHGFQGSVGEVGVADLHEIRLAARDGQCLAVYYLNTATGWMAWLVGSEGIVAFEPLEAIGEVVEELIQHLPYGTDSDAPLTPEAARGPPLRMRPAEAVDTVLHRLGDRLFPVAFQAAMTASGLGRLAIVADGDLHYVPFACLRPGGERYLVEDFELLFWPSTTCLLLCQSEQAAPSRGTRLRPIVIGDPELSGAIAMREREGAAAIVFDPLPGARAEAGLAGQALGVDPWLGLAAGWQNIHDCFYGEGRSWRPYVPVIHIAAHGVLVSASPEDSFLALADGPLRARFLYGFDPGIRADLVVLSCCQTGLGGLHPDSVVGLANAFLVAGACAVMSTLWRVPDIATHELIQAFYAGTQSGDAVVAALCQAQRAMLRRPDRVHPLYWGGFKISGANVSLADAPVVDNPAGEPVAEVQPGPEGSADRQMIQGGQTLMYVRPGATRDSPAT